MRQSIVWVILLWQATLGITTNAKYYHETYQDAPVQRGGQNQHVAAPKTDVVVDQNHHDGPQPGAELVDAAMVELNKAPQPSHRRRRRPSGLVGTALRYILKAIPSGPATAPSSQSHDTTVSGALSNAIDLLEQAARQNNSDALYLLAEINFYGNYSHPRNLDVAFNHYRQLAHVYGNSTAQYMLGVYYSTGIADVVERDQAKALLYYTFAALRGNARAEMAVGFRHNAGIGTTKNCETAVKYYKSVADKAIAWHRSGPPGGMTWVQQAWRISDDDGGIYGEGASASSAGMNAFKPSPGSDANAAIDDVIEYLDLMSQKGDSKASYNLGRIYYEGQRGLDRDIDLARKYFILVASRYWRKDGRLHETLKPGIEKIATKAAGYLGRMYLRGDGVAQNFERARLWFERGIKQGDAQSQHGLGLMMLNGYGQKENVKLAMELFKASADQDHAPALVQMGHLYLDQGGQEDVRIANNYFELAGRHGNIEAHYYIAEMVHHGVGREKLCSASLTYYKSVAEKAEPLVSSWGDANDAYEAGDYELAFLEYLLAAEQGYERAQTNVAYMLDSVQSRFSLSSLLQQGRKQSSLLKNPALALVYWTRSSRQSNVDSLVKMGDYYFYGIGTELDVSKAVQCYTGASDYSQSAQALFNLGWMHENGIGLVQDFHLAKRYYDHALEVNEEAYLPVTLSLLKLRLRSAWNTLTHGPIHSIQDEPKPKKDRSLSEWIANFLQDDGLIYDEEFYAGDDLYDGALGGGDGTGEDDGVLESILIIGITISLVFLLWWRQRLQQAHQQAEDVRRGEQGLPPNPRADNGREGPDFAGWAAGGVGL
ncbi:HRD3-involved in degradation of Hmg2p [Fusarium albosuccineum]|uniref:HRD3-involved in degradation of Hmg2p n=1 Tax=Fusarium albosuccineum TaxID=1237068 RepID=A0A8H4LDF6_9HYPO|nr:HRD3-involved in degradation of Hmg2p [Fusarium albosuccineum]